MSEAPTEFTFTNVVDIVDKISVILLILLSNGGTMITLVACIPMIISL